MTLEIPQEKGYKVPGFTDQQNRAFWLRQDTFNHRFEFFLNLSLVGLLVVMNLQFMPFFYPKTELSLQTFYFFLFFNFFHSYLFTYKYFSAICTLPVFLPTILKFFEIRFEQMGKKLQALLDQTVLEERKLDRKLSDLILVFNRTSLELLNVNQYMSKMIGVNFFFYIGVLVLLIFLMLSIDLKLRIIFFAVIVITYILHIYLPYALNNHILAEMATAGRLFQNIAFHKKTSLKVKKEVNYISFYLKDRQAAFTCFSLFTLTSYYGFLISLNVAMYTMMLIKISNYEL